MRSKKDLKQIAFDIVGEKIFADFCIPAYEYNQMMPSVFMVIPLMNEEQRKTFDDVGAVYEEMSEALDRSVNGYPIFFSCQTLDLKEATYVKNHVRKIARQREGLNWWTDLKARLTKIKFIKPDRETEKENIDECFLVEEEIKLIPQKKGGE